METPPRPAQTIDMDSLENPRTPVAAGVETNIQEGFALPPDAPSTSQDVGGMMKIVPSELDVSSLLHYLFNRFY
jgi:transcription factor E2F3